MGWKSNDKIKSPALPFQLGGINQDKVWQPSEVPREASGMALVGMGGMATPVGDRWLSWTPWAPQTLRWDRRVPGHQWDR